MTTNQHLFLDIHAIQTLPPSNINRDDTGSPKTAQYGGVRRARVSSQSWKRAMRKYFEDNNNVKNIGVRTLRIVDSIANNVVEISNNINFDDAQRLTIELLNRIKNKKGDKIFSVDNDYKISALFFMSESQSRRLAEIILDRNFAEICVEYDGVSNKVKEDKDYKKTSEYKEINNKYNNKIKEVKQILQDCLSLDIALFGRMLANDPSLNEDASSQVAHAISTHAVQTEFDFYTAVDDLAPDDNAGAGMLGTIEFNSSTLYRYANVAVHDLMKQLGDKESLVNSLSLFIEAFVKSLPTGKVTSFANQTLPQALVVTLRNDRPVSLVSAFEKPVKSTEGYVVQSIEKLVNEFVKVEKFVNKPMLTFYITLEDVEELKSIGGIEKNSVSELLSDFSKEVSQLIQE
ncbi:type I-E CRISPR-associated protein Cas7/Cse4/CasC [Streptococcus chenjunshii]|uniref:Type I-E CRISPR-associated protein Cas7/Cse4/CasC n=1 Tax=Streptococcus chenjunshii TaxID=2173853 RepID=A0A372KQQ3_9STRE|nr:type I-E CRISPR-associated protein Cas7/Cse4/CasC [Streptococcus chenjunshii]AXQ78445.1 type I-E CRISPR-associated protein Cas7/Cse4/CasC [Streptococcus chenjunshii]RFU52094.1 type I-E CRISPR-associated protein Cas7/Cse4/CasC [Streptococcus chenjunshii]RFU54286.1 type I-E CRISPR-associated protein Cas7/Cse4/CasC [Streptococcus chenjunshii]